MVRKLMLLALALLLAPNPARAAGDLSDAEILAFAGPKTCEFGEFPDQAPRALSIPLITLEPGITYEYCFRLPRLNPSDIPSKTNGWVTLSTANLANTSCGTASVYLIRPKRKPLAVPRSSVPRAYATLATPQHVMVMRYTPGVWRVLLRGDTGFDDKCTKYQVDVTW